MSKYDEIKNTIDMYTEGVNKKWKRREEKFKKEHNYDPKTKTIETDIKDENGNKQRVKLSITRDAHGKAMAKYPDPKTTAVSERRIKDCEIVMPKKTLQRHPSISNSHFKHEEGHIAYYLNPDKYNHLIKEIQSLIDSCHKTMNPHGKNPEEYIADLYSANHSKGGSNDMIRGLEKIGLSKQDQKDEIKYEVKTRLNTLVANMDGDIVKSKHASNIRRLKQERAISQDSLKKWISFLNLVKANSQGKHENNDRIMNYINKSKSDIEKYTTEINKLQKELDDEYERLKASIGKEKIDNVKEGIRTSKGFDIKNPDLTDQKNEIELRKKYIQSKTMKESTELKVKIYEACANNEITVDERTILLAMLG